MKIIFYVNIYIILYNEENNLIEISSPKNINISKEQTGCAFDKVINLIENNINEPEIVQFVLINL